MRDFKFETQFARRAEQRVFAASGDPTVVQYVAERDADGILQLNEAGSHDLYQDIQSYAASCDLQVIINRYFNGDPGALARVQGVYADLDGMPDNIHEVYNLMQRAQADFGSLPADIQAKFGNDPMQFLATLGSPEWLEKMQMPQPEAPGEATDVVKDAVQRAEVVRESEV